MPDQTTLNGRPTDNSPASGVGHNLAGLTHDLISLAELQCQLVAVDLKESISHSLLPIGLIAAAVLIALGTMPVALLGIGWALINLGGFSEGAAFLTVSLVALVIAAGAVWWGVLKLKSAVQILKRSQRELSENVRWVKQALLQRKTRGELYRQRV